ncbi:MAG TPA: c-type cytochrome [Gemmatimonadales bacterium]
MLLAAVIACGGSETSSVSVAGDSAAAVTGTEVAAAEFRVPADSEMPDGVLGASIRRGRALLNGTRDSLPEHVGNELRCTSCHLENGTRANSMPWVGVYARFPQYRSRNDDVNVLADRISDCFERSMNGRPLPADGQEVKDMIAYMAFLSQGYPVGTDVEGQGLPRMEPLEADSARGAEVFAASCAVCHGVGGQGTPAAPPLWGPESYNIGAGMARLRTAASFIRHNMPFGNPNLTDQQAFDVAAYVNSHPRPDLPGKENDWPRGNPPPDVAYPTRAAQGGAAASTGGAP